MKERELCPRDFRSRPATSPCYAEKEIGDVNAADIDVKDPEIKVENLDIEIKNLEIKVENLDIKVENLDIKKKNLDIEKKNLDIEIKNLDIKVKNLDIKMKNLDIETEDLEVATKFGELLPKLVRSRSSLGQNWNSGVFTFCRARPSNTSEERGFVKGANSGTARKNANDSRRAGLRS